MIHAEFYAAHRRMTSNNKLILQFQIYSSTIFRHKINIGGNLSVSEVPDSRSWAVSLRIVRDQGGLSGISGAVGSTGKEIGFEADRDNIVVAQGGPAGSPPDQGGGGRERGMMHNEGPRVSRQAGERHTPPAGDNRFGVPHQRVRHAIAGRFALVVLLTLATIGIAFVATTGNMTDADASSERLQEQPREQPRAESGTIRN